MRRTWFRFFYSLCLHVKVADPLVFRMLTSVVLRGITHAYAACRTRQLILVLPPVRSSLPNNAMSEVSAAAAASVDSNKRSRLDVAESAADNSDKRKNDQRKKDAKKHEQILEWRFRTSKLAAMLMDRNTGPDLFRSPHFHELKGLIQYIAMRPEEYGLDMDDPEDGGSSLQYWNETDLSTSVLESDLIESMQGWQFEPPEGSPVVQIVAIEARKEEGYGKDDPIRRTITVSVSDASRRTIRGRLAVSAAGVDRLRPGHVVGLNRFYRYVVRPTDKNDMTEVWMLILDLTIVGMGPTDAPMVAYPTAALADIKSEKPVKDDRGGSDDDNGDDGDDWDPRFEPPPKPDSCCTASNRLCSLYGQVFTSHCICEQMPVPDDLEAVYDAYQGTTEPLESMSNSLKRNMVYWMYATDVFMVRGQGIRKPLPPCLVYCIRCKYPNDKGVSYKGYEAYGSG